MLIFFLVLTLGFAFELGPAAFNLTKPRPRRYERQVNHCTSPTAQSQSRRENAEEKVNSMATVITPVRRTRMRM